MNCTHRTIKYSIIRNSIVRYNDKRYFPSLTGVNRADQPRNNVASMS